MDLPGPLEKQVGPFPVVAWLGIIGGGLGLAWFIRRSDLFGGEGSVEPIDDVVAGEETDVYAPGVTGTATSGYFGGGFGGGAGGSVVPIPQQTNPPTSSPIATNQEWQNAAIVWAQSHDISGVTASRVTGAYLQGDAISSGEAAVLGQILGAIGPPPEGAPPANVVSSPPPVVTPTPSPVPLPVPIPQPNPQPAPQPQPAPSSVAPVPPFPGRNMKLTNPMMRGADVSAVQAQLVRIGFSEVAVDGIFGPKTQAAVAYFQQVHHLTQDGIVGPNTWSALHRWPNL